MSLESTIITQAAAYAPLAALLGTPFRMYEQRLPPGSLFPAVVFFLVAGSDDYVLNRRLPTGFSRYQFTIYADLPTTARAVDDALTCFMNVFNGIGIPNLPQYPNQIVLRRASDIPRPDPPKYTRTLDVQIFSNELATA